MIGYTGTERIDDWLYWEREGRSLDMCGSVMTLIFRDD